MNEIICDNRNWIKSERKPCSVMMTTQEYFCVKWHLVPMGSVLLGTFHFLNLTTLEIRTGAHEADVLSTFKMLLHPEGCPPSKASSWVSHPPLQRQTH